MYVPPICYGIIMMRAIDNKEPKRSEPHPFDAMHLEDISWGASWDLSAPTGIPVPETFIAPTDLKELWFFSR